jgi:hypothetical protein
MNRKRLGVVSRPNIGSTTPRPPMKLLSQFAKTRLDRHYGITSVSPSSHPSFLKEPSLEENAPLVTHPRNRRRCGNKSDAGKLLRLQPATSSLLASVVDSDGSFCTFNHARRLNTLMQMQNTFAGIKPYCDVCNPITQTMRLLTPETTRPVHIFLPNRIVATTVRKQEI